MSSHDQVVTRLPGELLATEKMPAYWLFARLGKRVLRPGGRAMTHLLLEKMAISSPDRIVEMAPGFGVTTKLLLAANPAAYVGIERDANAANVVKQLFQHPDYTCRVGSAQATGLPDGGTDAMFGEAYMTMQSDSVKTEIIHEAFRVLDSGGRLGLHELAVFPDSLPAGLQKQMRSDFVHALNVGSRPLTIAAWRELLIEAGFEVEFETTAPFALLSPRRIIADEGLLQTLRIAATAATHPILRRRVWEVRSCFHKYQANLCALGIIARKP